MGDTPLTPHTHSIAVHTQEDGLLAPEQPLVRLRLAKLKLGTPHTEPRTFLEPSPEPSRSLTSLSAYSQACTRPS